MRTPTMRRHSTTAILLFLLVTPALVAQAPRLDDLARQGQGYEQRGDWLEACKAYGEAFRLERNRIDLREAYQRCLRHYYLQQRHRDPGYRAILAKLDSSQAREIYAQVLRLVEATYVDQQKSNVSVLFQNGLEELRYALDDEVFRKEYLGAVKPEVLRAFRNRLEDWTDRKIVSRDDACEQVLAVVRAGQQLGLKTQPGLLPLLSLEFASGACNSLDEYTLFLTPSQRTDAQAALRSRLVGVGVELAIVEQRVEIARVYPRSPAEEAGLMVRDRILEIGGQPVEMLSAELIAERLRGETGTILKLKVKPGQMEIRDLALVRRHVVAPSVEFKLLDSMAMDAELLGYIRILNFQDSTLQEVKEAIAHFNSVNVKGLVLDLRGNPGGLFESAMHISELFLAEGVIAHGTSPLERFNKPFVSRSLNPLLIPMAVLVDGETASSAEALAGALKEQKRARLIGTTTYGKGSIQVVIPLKKSPGGIRITVAHFTSPTHQPYDGRGIAPHDFVPPEGNAALLAAQAHLQSMLRVMMR